MQMCLLHYVLFSVTVRSNYHKAHPEPSRIDDPCLCSGHCKHRPLLPQDAARAPKTVQSKTSAIPWNPQTFQGITPFAPSTQASWEQCWELKWEASHSSLTSSLNYRYTNVIHLLRRDTPWVGSGTSALVKVLPLAHALTLSSVGRWLCVICVMPSTFSSNTSSLHALLNNFILVLLSLVI